MTSEITPIHIQLKKGEVADRVLIAGDPERIKEISKLLTKPKLLNTYRFLVYTGEYKGKRVTLASHGIGGPSVAIAIEELHALGGKSFIRLGSCGGLKKGQNYGDIIIPDAAYFNSGGTIGAYIENSKSPATPDLDLTKKLEEKTKEKGRKYFVGPIFSSDAFYKEYEQLEKMKSLKLIGLEMECATIFTIAHLRGFKSASLLIVVDNLIEDVPFLPVPKMHEMAKEVAVIALDTLVNFE